MKKSNLTLLLLIFFSAAFAQQNPDKIILSISRNGNTHQMYVENASIDFNKLDLDTSIDRNGSTVVMINCDSLPRFILEAAGGDTDNKINVSIHQEDKNGKVLKSYQLKNALITDFSDSMNGKTEEDNLDNRGAYSITIMSKNLKINEIKM
ncbi:hypothetical protein [Arachidicoccus soli]|uniref:Uncharacterized protein n=1 Tax=Arachidicoccus soli TaxID=2341117 RepID=A0A386HQD7_9BACT|nr:hypothetical protein [Arachidicoccus soli]AYD47786.1 hypothetical protein D6B99_09390 [Arachidicoccus soli]